MTPTTDNGPRPHSRGRTITALAIASALVVVPSVAAGAAKPLYRGVRGQHPQRALPVPTDAVYASATGKATPLVHVPRAVVGALEAANRIAELPYRFGGGHGRFSDTAYDCSGSVSYVLHAAGRLGVSRSSPGFMGYGAPGPGRWITVYANPGHAFMVIMGRRFDTSGRYASGTRWQPTQRSTAGYTVRHPAGL